MNRLAGTLSLVAVAALAAYSDDQPPSAEISWRPSPEEHQQLCGTSTFHRESVLHPASWRDCAELSSTWGRYAGHFEMQPLHEGPAQAVVVLVESSACAIGVDVAGQSRLGDLDVAGMLHGALLNLSSGSLVGGWGEMECQGTILRWDLFDSQASRT